ncbi:MAG TPA: metallophosphoesterase [Candidatus Synoicihabitans sp.]|nr:metallophosphoesterase [Candidatus Synoicihabitans sp.]
MVTRIEVEPGIWLDGRRALWLAASGSLVVADLHWGYAASHRRAGNLLPAWGDETITRTLDALIEDYTPREMIWLGDVVHAAAGRAAAEAYLTRAAAPVVVLKGNHDRSWRGPAQQAIERGGFLLHHGDINQPGGPLRREMIGHLHPCVAYHDGAGASLRLPALAVGAHRWILPAFSPWAAGAPCRGAGSPGEIVWAIAPRRIFAVKPRHVRTPSSA